jgi:hypothetical protein
MMILNSAIRKLWDRNNQTSIQLDKETLNRTQNDDTRLSANKISPFFKKVQTFSTEFATLNEFVVNDNEAYYYNFWQIQIFEGEETDMDRMLDLYASSINYDIIYQEAGGDFLDFYNTGKDLQEMSFFSVEGNVLFYNVSLVIGQTYKGVPVVNPQVKLEVNVKPFFTVS